MDFIAIQIFPRATDLLITIDKMEHVFNTVWNLNPICEWAAIWSTAKWSISIKSTEKLNVDIEITCETTYPTVHVRSSYCICWYKIIIIKKNNKQEIKSEKCIHLNLFESIVCAFGFTVDGVMHVLSQKVNFNYWEQCCCCVLTLYVHTLRSKLKHKRKYLDRSKQSETYSKKLNFDGNKTIIRILGYFNMWVPLCEANKAISVQYNKFVWNIYIHVDFIPFEWFLKFFG